MTMKYDLHMHSTCSDGERTPEELILQAVDLSLTGISITDHDTTKAYTPELFQFAKDHNIDLLTGVEFSAIYEDISVHILGYCFDPEDSGLKHLSEKHETRRKERNLRILELLAAKGMPIDPSELYIQEGKTLVVGRPHIAKAMERRGYVSNTAEAFNHWIGDDRPCFTRGMSISIEETIDAIHNASGKAVIAHPILLKRKKFILKLLEFPFDGMECYYAKFSEHQNEEMASIALNKGLIITGGSDFHGSNVKPHNSMGSSYTNEDNINRLKNDPIRRDS